MEITSELLFSSVGELSALIQSQKITSLALTESYLERLAKFGEKLGAVVTITKELALKQAKEADEEIKAGKYRGPLHGIPYGVKDLLATKAIPTTWGAAPYKDQVFDYDATVVKKLTEAGAVLVAKLAMVELAGGFGYNSADSSFTGPGKTPWNTNFWSGGSSSGSGAAVSAGLVAFAIGSETSGSIICPSSFCGVTGLRPTYGRVSRHGAMALCWTLDKLGPICRTADDCALVLATISGQDPLDASSVDKPFVYKNISEGKKRFKLGIVKNCFQKAQTEVRENFTASVKILREFADVDSEVALPDMPFGQVIELIVGAEGASAFRDLIESGRSKELRNPKDKWGGYAGTAVLAIDYLQALRVREPMKKAMDEVFSKYDALISPSFPCVSYPIDKPFEEVYKDIDFGAPVISADNAVGQPAISVPNGFGENALPTGLQFIGRVWSENTLVEIANQYQKLTDWHKRRPPLS
ncbi:MAG: amidase [Blastocatellia bacterium]|nr:amidase [Blastocatellia bacterium]MBN8721887.1 amidase [Acidobacteriota bacterium]